MIHGYTYKPGSLINTPEHTCTRVHALGYPIMTSNPIIMRGTEYELDCKANVKSVKWRLTRLHPIGMNRNTLAV